MVRIAMDSSLHDGQIGGRRVALSPKETLQRPGQERGWHVREAVPVSRSGGHACSLNTKGARCSTPPAHCSLRSLGHGDVATLVFARRACERTPWYSGTHLGLNARPKSPQGRELRGLHSPQNLVQIARKIELKEYRTIGCYDEVPGQNHAIAQKGIACVNICCLLSVTHEISRSASLPDAFRHDLVVCRWCWHVATPGVQQAVSAEGAVRVALAAECDQQLEAQQLRAPPSHADGHCTETVRTVVVKSDDAALQHVLRFRQESFQHINGHTALAGCGEAHDLGSRRTDVGLGDEWRAWGDADDLHL
mmetsp:Transcript_101306/g.285665  ORF Transcript_101306/g.285665 Transcript_101306/m.285665 type:complete len:307 (+) Transcript_101306:148-1068(+)